MIFMCFWPLFPEHAWSRVACAGVPLLSTVVIGLVGSGVIQDEAMVAAASVRPHPPSPGLQKPVHEAAASLRVRICIPHVTYSRRLTIR